eukprot:2018232-Pyramimonas_sp.AAC.1
MCGVEAGTDTHRIFRCDWHALERHSWTGKERTLLTWGRTEHGQGHPITMMTTKGLMPDPTFYAPLPTFDDIINWHKCT